ncbi:ASC-1 homology (ASCH) domain-containing protein [Ruminococcus sp. YE71]|uniref:ASCH domain-containing protein n=1 Tax=unclassified Ruminococcus TaxID=2608920 RepID=UPI00088BB1B1|nr:MULTISPECIES: ASCH domain-containing protein [unclassified Ruminococcus]SDA29944.1 ASC-1 homology (ASCH) domain-containing protein [Ruminococcus sp. YE78]SFW49044.1 ASC-1 homology (ASCH) domain-containing protein [Ruminococcus sp. YE71]
MTHKMNLNPSPFENIRNGTKTIELRLYDEKRRKIKIGDTIIFTNNNSNDETLEVKVVGLHIFDSFEALYDKLPLLKCGYNEQTVQTAAPKDMEAYYSRERQQEYGVVGIEIGRL